MTYKRAAGMQPDGQVVVRGGSAADQRRIADALEAAHFSVAIPESGADEAASALPSVQVLPEPQGDPVFAEAVNWQAFAGELLASAETRTAAFFLVNLDHFQRVRAMLGYTASETLLREVAARLKLAMAGHPKARLLHVGGDEFALLVPGLGEPEAASRFADSILNAISHPYDGIVSHAFVTARVGVVLYPKDGADIEALVQHALSVVHHEARRGRNTVQFYAHGMTTLAAERFKLEAELHQAIRNDELEVYYQPQVSFATGAIIGAEALVRWRRPDVGTVPADVFVALAEDLGLIADLGKWVLTRAAAECRAWQQAGHVPIRVSINASSYQFRRVDMVAVVARALEESALDPDYLMLEVTESLVMSDIEQTLNSLTRLRDMGIHIALDDFGTGYSSLSYLKTLALDCLKIDRSFVNGLPEDRGDYAVTEAIIRMAKALHLSVMAEGVETEAQRDCLARLGCDSYQGYLTSQPLPAADFVKLLSMKAA